MFNKKRKIIIIGALIICFLLLFLVFIMPRYVHEDDHTTALTAKMRIFQICVALDKYYLDKNKYPTMTEGLKILLKEEYLDRLMKDPWGNDFLYYSGRTGYVYYYEVWSYGSDSVPGGDGHKRDIRSTDFLEEWRREPGSRAGGKP